MGDNFLKRQVRNFKKGRDKALVTLSKPTLFTTPELLGKTFPVFEVNGHTFEPQDVLLAVRLARRAGSSSCEVHIMSDMPRVMLPSHLLTLPVATECMSGLNRETIYRVWRRCESCRPE